MIQGLILKKNEDLSNQNQLALMESLLSIQRQFCCICYIQQNKYCVTSVFYKENKDICEEYGYFVKCTCKEGIYCKTCFIMLDTKCAICRTVIKQEVNELNDSMLSELEDLASETAGSILVTLNRNQQENPIIRISFDNFLSDQPGYEFEYTILFTVSEELYQILQNANNANIYQQSIRLGIMQIPGFDIHELDEFSDENGHILPATFISAFFATQMRQSLIDLIYDFMRDEHILHTHLQTGGIMQNILNQWFEYCVFPFYHDQNENIASIALQQIPNNINRFSARILNTGINQYSLNIHLGNLNAAQRTITDLEINQFYIDNQQEIQIINNQQENQIINNQQEDQIANNYQQYFETVSIILDQQEQQFDVEFDFIDMSYSLGISYKVNITQSIINQLFVQDSSILPQNINSSLNQQIMQFPEVNNDQWWLQSAQNQNFQTVFLQYIAIKIREAITNTMEQYSTDIDFQVQMESQGFAEQFQDRTLIQEFTNMQIPLYVYLQMSAQFPESYMLLIRY